MIERRATLKFLVSDDGPTAVEYSVVLGIVMAVCLAVVEIGQSVKGSLSKSGTAIGASTNGSR